MIRFLRGGNFQKVENHWCRKTGRDLHLDSKRIFDFVLSVKKPLSDIEFENRTPGPEALDTHGCPHREGSCFVYRKNTPN